MHNYIKVEVTPKWKELGIQLLNEEHIKQLDVIETDYPAGSGESEKRCLELFKYWLQVDTNASWNKLIAALENIHHDVLADKIRNMTSEG